MAAVARPKYFESKNAIFLEKRPITAHYGKIFKILFRKFSPPHRSTLLRSNVFKFVRREIGKILRYLPDQKTKTKCRRPLKRKVLFGSCPKSARASPQQCAHSAPDFIQIGSLSAELAYSRMREHHFFAP